MTSIPPGFAASTGGGRDPRHGTVDGLTCRSPGPLRPGPLHRPGPDPFAGSVRIALRGDPIISDESAATLGNPHRDENRVDTAGTGREHSGFGTRHHADAFLRKQDDIRLDAGGKGACFPVICPNLRSHPESIRTDASVTPALVCGAFMQEAGGRTGTEIGKAGQLEGRYGPAAGFEPGDGGAGKPERLRCGVPAEAAGLARRAQP